MFAGASPRALIVVCGGLFWATFAPGCTCSGEGRSPSPDTRQAGTSYGAPAAPISSGPTDAPSRKAPRPDRPARPVATRSAGGISFHGYRKATVEAASQVARGVDRGLAALSRADDQAEIARLMDAFLASENLNEQTAALRWFGTSGGDAAPKNLAAIEAAARHEVASVRHAAWAYLAGAHAKSAAGIFRDVLEANDRSAEDVRAAINSARRLDDPTLLPPLLRYLAPSATMRRSDRDVADRAARAAGAIAGAMNHPAAATDLVKTMGLARASAGAPASWIPWATALNTAGQPLPPWLFDRLTGPDADAASQVAAFAGRWQTTAQGDRRHALALQTPHDPQVKRAHLSALARAHDPRTIATVKALLAAAADGHARAATIATLGPCLYAESADLKTADLKTADLKTATVGLLSHLVADPWPAARGAAVATLAALAARSGVDAEIIAPILVERLDAETDEAVLPVIYGVIAALKPTAETPETRAAVAALIDALGDPERGVQIALALSTATAKPMSRHKQGWLAWLSAQAPAPAPGTPDSKAPSQASPDLKKQDPGSPTSKSPAKPGAQTGDAAP